MTSLMTSPATVAQKVIHRASSGSCPLDQKKLVQTKAPALVLKMSYFWEKWVAPVLTCCRRLLSGRGASGPFEEALLCTRNGRLRADRLVRLQVTVDVNDTASTML